MDPVKDTTPMWMGKSVCFEKSLQGIILVSFPKSNRTAYWRFKFLRALVHFGRVGLPLSHPGPTFPLGLAHLEGIFCMMLALRK
jgi:hypothetical protein